MTKTKFNWLLSILVAIMTFSLLGAYAFAVPTVNAQSGTWSGQNYATSTEDGKQVLTATTTDVGGGVVTLNYSDTVEEYNTVSLKYRPNATFNGSDTANFGLHVQDKKGNLLSFTFLNYWNCHRILLNNVVKVEGNYPPNTVDGWSDTSTWFDIKCIYSKNNAKIYVGGELMGTLNNTGAFDFTQGVTCFITSWGSKPSFKEIAFSTTELPKLDPEWLSDYYSKTMEDGKQVLTATTTDVGGGVVTLNYSDTVEAYNAVSLKYRPNATFNGGDTANFGLHVQDKNGNLLSFTFLNYWNCHRILLNNVVKVEGNYPPNTVDGWSDTSTWFDIKCVYSKNNAKIYVGGELMGTLNNTGAFDFTQDVTCFITSWGSKPSFKEITFSNEELENVSGWLGDFTKTTENGEDLYSSGEEKLESLKNLNYSNTTKENNALTFEVKFNDVGEDDERNLSLNVVSSTDANQFACLQVMPRWNACRIQMFNGNIGTILNAGNYQESEWLTVKCVFEYNYLAMYVNGEVVSEAFNTSWNEFIDTSLYFSIWGTSATIKNIEFSKEDVLDGGEWRGKDYNVYQEDGQTAYGKEYAQGSISTLTYSSLTEDNNSVTFDVKTGTEGYFLERNAGFVLYGRETNDYLFFEVMPGTKEARIRLVSGNHAIFAVRAEYVDYVADDWMTVQCVFEDTYCAMFLNGKLMASYFDIKDYTFSNTMAVLSSWDTAANFKNVTFSKVEKTYTELGYADLDFLDERGFDAVSTQNATATYDAEKQAVIANVTGEDPIVNFVVTQPSGGKYCAYLPVRNTVLLRVDNQTSANTIVVYFTTDDDPGVEYKKEFAISSESGFKTYYFNLSDLDASGYLTGLKFQFRGTAQGQIIIDAISFEREDPIYDFAAVDLSCTAKGSTVYLQGKVESQYIGKKITLYSITSTNIEESIFDSQNVVVMTGTSDREGNFNMSFPIEYNGGRSNHLTSIFLAEVDGVKLSRAFQIENYRDFITNPYAFTLKDLTVDVTEDRFGAVGDGFTNDNRAIQKAIDYVSEQGGGKVVIPGDLTSPYGRRFVATNLELKSNVELYIEEGAVIWQSPRQADYGYDLIIGHDYDSDVMWSHACNVNRPLILARQAKNVRITGGGTIRMTDWGGEDTSPWDLIDPNHGAGCANIIHIAPLYITSCENVEVSDIKILRTNNWNLSCVFVKNAFVANVYFGEANCKNSDGVGMTNCNGMLVVRNRAFTTDDSYTINSIPDDPRWLMDWAKPPVDAEYFASQNIEIAYNNIRGGLGVVFVPWGTAKEKSYLAEIKNVVAYNNVFAGFGQDIGSWPDNPFYGWSSNGDYVLGNGETDDFSPIKDVYMFNNVYFNNTALMGWQGGPCIADFTNFNSDADIKCNSQFVNASFERNLRYDNEVTWESGLSYWTYFAKDGGEVGYLQRGQKEAVAKYSQKTHTVTDYMGYVSGNGALYQGLYLEKGWHVFTAQVKNLSLSAKMFVGQSVIKKHVTDETAVTVLQTQQLVKSEDFETVTFRFRVEVGGVYAIGFINESTDQEILYVDDASIVEDESANQAEKEIEELKAQLLIKINIAKFIQGDGYTAQSFANLQTAIQSATNVYANANASKYSITICMQALDDAINGLENAPEQSESEQESQESEEITDSESDSQNPSESQEPSEESSSTSHKTNKGCGSGIFGGVEFLTIILCVAVLVICKRRSSLNG